MVGVGIGIGDPAGGAPPGEPTLEVYMIEPSTEAEMKARLASVTGVSALAAADFPMNVVCTRIIDAQPHRMRLRPRRAASASGTCASPLARSAVWSAGAPRRAATG